MPLLRNLPGTPGWRDSLPDPSVSFPSDRGSLCPGRFAGGGSQESACRGDTPLLPQGRTQPEEEGGNEHPLVHPQPSCRPDGLPCPNSCSPVERNFPPQGQGGDMPERATSTLVSETMESGSLRFFPSTGPQTWPRACHSCPSEHTSGVAQPPGRGGRGSGAQLKPQHQWRTDPHMNPSGAFGTRGIIFKEVSADIPDQ